MITGKREMLRTRNQSLVPAERTIDSQGRKICGATKSKGGICCSRMVMRNGRCHKHGGATPSGPLSPQYKNGRYVKDLPPNLRGRYEEAMGDEELLSLRRDISLLEAMQTAKMAELNEAIQNPDLEIISSLVNEMARDSMGWDWTRMQRQLTTLQEAIGRRTQIERTFVEVRDLMNQKAGLITHENQRMYQLNQHMSVEQGMALIRMLIGSIRLACSQEEDAGTRILRRVTADYRNAISIREL